MLMIKVRCPIAQFRKPYARAYGETFEFAPPATVYGMLMSVIGETRKMLHRQVKMSFLYRSKPQTFDMLQSLTRTKYGVAGKKGDNSMMLDYVEYLSGLEFIIALDSSDETEKPTLEEKLAAAFKNPESIKRFGILSLGLSDNIVEYISPIETVVGDWMELVPDPRGSISLITWVDQCDTVNNRFHRYSLSEPRTADLWPQPQNFVALS